MFGFEYTVGLEPVNVNVERMLGIFRTGLRELGSVWERALAPATLREIRALAAVADGEFRFPPEAWVHTIYDFACAFHAAGINRDHLLKSLVPLYLGRTASFVLETRDAGAAEVEAILESLCRTYEELKPYLKQRWSTQTGGV